MHDRGFEWRLFVALWLLGLTGVASLIAVPFETLAPPGLGFGAAQLRLLSLINPLVLMTAAVAIGCLLAGRVGLDAPLTRALVERRAAWPALRLQLLPASLLGASVAAILLVFASLTADLLAASVPAGFAMPLVSKLLYGGIAEELLTRWGLMTLFTWVAWRLTGARQPIGPSAYVIGAVLAALLFAAGHLPMLYMLVPSPTTGLLAGVLIGNTVPGLLFGWLFWRHGLEAAMLAHALAHLISTVLG